MYRWGRSLYPGYGSGPGITTSAQWRSSISQNPLQSPQEVFNELTALFAGTDYDLINPDDTIINLYLVIFKARRAYFLYRT